MTNHQMQPSRNGIMVRKAQLRDADALKMLADANRKELGFVLRPSLIESISRNQVLVAVTGTPELVVGFVEYRHRKDEQTTLYHILVSSEYRRRGIGRTLIRTLGFESMESGKGHILLKCPEDLESNTFYRSLGFQLVATENGKTRRLNVWRLDLALNDV